MLFFFLGLVVLALAVFTLGEESGKGASKRAELEKKVEEAKKSLETAKIDLTAGPASYVGYVVIVILIAGFATVTLKRCEDAVQYERRIGGW